jgi:hypothetical protein
MAGMVTEAIRNALDEMVKRQIELEKLVDQASNDEQFIKLLTSQGELIKSTFSLYNQIY